MKKIEINHNTETLNQGLGISDERMDELNKKAYEALEDANKVKGGLTISEAVAIILTIAETEEERIPLLLSAGAVYADSMGNNEDN